MHAISGCTREKQLSYLTVINKRKYLPEKAFTNEWRAGLLRMGDVIPDVDVLAEQLRADAITEKRPLIENGESTEIEESKANGVEHSRRLENYSVFAGWNFARRCGSGSFFCRDLT